MKSFRWTWIVLVVVAGLATFTIFDFKKSQQQEEREEKEEQVLRLASDSLVHIEITDMDKKIVLDKKDKNWQLTQPQEDLADEQIAQSFLMSLNGEKIKQTVAEGEGLDLGTYGLKTPVKKLKVTTGDGKSEEVRIGSVKAFDGSLYAQIDQDKKVFLVGQSWDPMLSKSVKEFRDKHAMRQDLWSAGLSAIEIHNAKLDSDFRLVKDATHWKIASGALSYPVADQKVDAFMSQLKGVRAQDYAAPDKKASGALASHGLVKPVLEIKLFKEQNKVPIFTVAVSDFAKKDSGQTAAITASVVSSDVNDILSVTKPVIDTISKSAQDFYDKKLPFRFTPAEVEKIEVAAPGVLTATFEKVGDVWAMTTAKADGATDASNGVKKVADGDKIKAAIDRLSNMEAVRILENLKKGATPPQLKSASRITLFKKLGAPLFSFEWGASVIESATAKRPEARYLPARTDQVDVLIGVTEGDLSGLELAKWLKDPLAPGSTPSMIAPSRTPFLHSSGRLPNRPTK